MSDPNSDTSSDSPTGTLYDPPASSGNSSNADEETVGLSLSLSEDQAERLRSVAQQLGLNPSTLAQRAIEMVCEEVVTIQEDSRSPNLLVEQYQARIDLLHAVDEEPPAEEEAASLESDGDEPQPSEEKEETTESEENSEN